MNGQPVGAAPPHPGVPRAVAERVYSTVYGPGQRVTSWQGLRLQLQQLGHRATGSTVEYIPGGRFGHAANIVNWRGQVWLVDAQPLVPKFWLLDEGGAVARDFFQGPTGLATDVYMAPGD
jgi:hypothetical protein